MRQGSCAARYPLPWLPRRLLCRFPRSGLVLCARPPARSRNCCASPPASAVGPCCAPGVLPVAIVASSLWGWRKAAVLAERVLCSAVSLLPSVRARARVGVPGCGRSVPSSPIAPPPPPPPLLVGHSPSLLLLCRRVPPAAATRRTCGRMEPFGHVVCFSAWFLRHSCARTLRCVSRLSRAGPNVRARPPRHVVPLACRRRTWLRCCTSGWRRTSACPAT